MDTFSFFFFSHGELIFRNTNVLAVNRAGRVKLILVVKRLFSLAFIPVLQYSLSSLGFLLP